MPWRANFFTMITFSKKRTQVRLQKELTEEKSQSLHSQK